MTVNVPMSNLKTKRRLSKNLEAFQVVRGLSESELETLEILSDLKGKGFVLRSLRESKENRVYPIRSILKK